MKIPKDIVEEMRSAISLLDTEDRRNRYRNGEFPRSDMVKDLDKRYRWDLLYSISDYYVTDTLYAIDGVNDTHIDTALRNIIPPL